MRIAVNLIIELDEEQVAAYAEDKGLPVFRDRLLEREVRYDVRSQVVEYLRRDFETLGAGATVTLKEG